MVIFEMIGLCNFSMSCNPWKFTPQWHLTVLTATHTKYNLAIKNINLAVYQTSSVINLAQIREIVAQMTKIIFLFFTNIIFTISHSNKYLYNLNN